ncbi:MAG: GumC family protein, partial [Geminicoccaceae bacterium]
MNTARSEDELSLWQLFRLLGAYRSMIAGALALSLGLALLLLVLVEPVYEARALILVEPGRDGAPDDAVASVGIANDSTVIDSQVKLLASRSLARQAIERLDLAHDDEFSAKATGRASNGDIETVIEAFLDRLEVERDGRTNAISLAFRSAMPDKAARIANELAAIYIEGQLTAKHESTRRGTDWLGDQLEQARQRFEQAEQVLRDYRTQSQPAYADAEALHGIDIANLKRDHIAALADAAARRSKLERVRRIIDEQPGVQAFEELGGSSVLQNLHALKNQTMRREAELATDFGSRHPRRLDLRSQLTRIDLQIATEQRALVGRMESELDQAVARERTLRRELDELKQQTLARREAETRIDELERDVEMTRRLYEGYLGRFESVSDIETMQRPDARLISEAVPPQAPVFPRPGQVFASFSAAGLVTVLLVILLLEHRDR